jgi:glyoxylase-like metal-dependent hydrolase (beta-lactamase superfamily II)/rhodanese-related sulfurtransferase
MSQVEFPEPATAVEATQPHALKETLDAGNPVTILDTRSRSEFDSWAIQGEAVSAVNIPYYEFLDGLTDELLQEVPDDDDLLVVCAKGDSSEFVAGLLNEAGYDATNLAEGMQGWARLYEHTDFTLDSGTIVRQYRRPSSGCLGYLVHDGEKAVVIDPLRAFTGRYLEDAEDLGVEINAVLDTHVHADHVSGVRQLADAADADIVLPEAVLGRGLDYDADYETVVGGSTIDVKGGATIEAMHTPGHTSGMTAYLIDEEIVLTGDTLFVGGVARPDLESGDEGAPEAAAKLHETLQNKLLALPPETLVGGAHYKPSANSRDDGAYVAPLGDIVRNVELLSAEESEFVEAVLADMPPRPANYEEIIATNLGQRSASDKEAFELELGPNNCAAGD